MQIISRGVIGSGIEQLDRGITDIETVVVEGALQVFTTTGRNGGVTEYRVGAEGELTHQTHVIYPPGITRTVSDKLAVLENDTGQPVVLVGSNDQGLMGYAVPDAGQLQGQLTHGLSADGQITDFATLDAWVEMTDLPLAGYPNPELCGQITSLAEAQFNGQTFVLVACEARDAVAVLRHDSFSGNFRETDTHGAEQGLGISAPTDVGTVVVNGQTYVILAASGTSSLSVLHLSETGELTPTDHLLDNGSTRFENVQVLATAQVGDQAFVVAGGADNGLTVYRVLPSGKLVHVATIADDDATSLHKVTALEVAVHGNEMHIFAGSQNDAGVSHFTIDLSSFGVFQNGTSAAETLVGTVGDDLLVAQGASDTLNGGSGDDVLVTGTDNTLLTGGNGRDTFVILNDSSTTRITDFRPGQDRLDLTDLPMLRDVAQLDIITTSNGARISYRGHDIRIESVDGKPLSASDLFPDGLDGGDRIGLGDGGGLELPLEDPPNPGDLIEGTDGSESLEGTERDDTLRGFKGRDTIEGGDGRDLIEGGDAKDLIKGGEGDDTLRGDRHSDTLLGGGGDDLIEGGRGQNKLDGQDGNDTIVGGPQKDNIWGGAGNDQITDPGGPNRIFAGAGNDTVQAGGRADRINGGKGDDLIDAGDGKNYVMGGKGNDTVISGSGNDKIYAFWGDDYVDAGDGNNNLWMARGDDIVVTGSGNDTIRAGPGDDQISTRGGTNEIKLGSGNDTATGGTGRDVILGEDGDDLIDSGEGNDRLEGGDGNDTLRAGVGDDQALGGVGDDYIELGDGTNAAWGEEGNDTIFGGAGNDWISGGDGDDVLHGGAGDDVFRGGLGNDTFYGGAGADVFEFFGNHQTGRIMDFDPSEGDLLRLSPTIWAQIGTLSAQQIVDRYASVDSDDNIVLDFTDLNGCVIILEDFSDLGALADQIEFM